MSTVTLKQPEFIPPPVATWPPVPLLPPVVVPVPPTPLLRPPVWLTVPPVVAAVPPVPEVDGDSSAEQPPLNTTIAGTKV